jgi:uncharacterized protein YjiS (DUF1127 family)
MSRVYLDGLSTSHILVLEKKMIGLAFSRFSVVRIFAPWALVSTQKNSSARTLFKGNFGINNNSLLVKSTYAALHVLYVWQDRAAQRRRLAVMDDRMLDDIGVNRGEAMREARKPFWRA